MDWEASTSSRSRRSSADPVTAPARERENLLDLTPAAAEERLRAFFTGRGAISGGLRMLLIGGAAGGGTYVIGSLLGVSLS